MNVLITCEFSGVMREAFQALDHTWAFSNDLLPCEDGRDDFHLQMDALEAIQHHGPWDLIGIHYTCTYFCNSGVRWLYGGKGTKPDPKRFALMHRAADEFARLWLAAVATGAKVYFENPVMHRHAAKALCDRIPGWSARPTQTVQPYEHGQPEKKRTGLWLHKLPPLKPTNDVRHLMAGRRKKETDRVHYASPGPNRWKERSRSFPGIAAAMAAQWAAPDFSVV